MCTAITMQTLQGDTFFGRTMDFSYQLHPEPYNIQKRYELDEAGFAKHPDCLCQTEAGLCARSRHPVLKETGKTRCL